MPDPLSTREDLISALLGDDVTKSNEAARTIADLGEESIPRLLDFLDKGDQSLRETISWILVEIGSPSVPVLTDTLQNGTPTQKIIAAEVLGNLADARSVNALIEALREESVDLRETAAWALVQIGGPVIPSVMEFIQNESSYFRKTAMWVLSGIGESSVSALIESLQTGKSRQNRLIIETLSDMGDSGLEALTALLTHEDNEIRLHAVKAMGSLISPESIDLLLPLLQDHDRDVRKECIQSIAEMGPQVFSTLFDSIIDDDSLLLDSIFMVFCSMGPDAADFLAGRLEGAAAEIRRRIVRVLGIIKSPHTVDILTGLLKDADANVKDIAAWALGETGDHRAIPSLIESIQDSSMGKNFSLAAWALGKLYAYESIDPLIGLLKSSEPAVRWKAALALGLLKDPRSTAALIECLKDPDPEVKRRVISSLGDSGDTASIQPLKELLLTEDVTFQSAVKEAIKRLKSGASGKPDRP